MTKLRAKSSMYVTGNKQSMFENQIAIAAVEGSNKYQESIAEGSEEALENAI